MNTTTAAHLDRYDTAEGQPSVGVEYHDGVDYADGFFTLADVKAAGGKVTRARFIGGARVDVSYVHATLPGGRIVPVSTGTMPRAHLIPRRAVKAAAVEWAKAEGVYAKALGLLDDSTYSIF